MRFALLWVALVLVWSCNAPPAFSVPRGPPKQIALDVQLPVYVLGRWIVDDFSESLILELAKYNIKVVDRRSRPRTVALIDLGRWTYSTWQEIDVAVDLDHERTPLGRIRIADESMTTLDAAAGPVAEVIARSLWRPDSPAGER